MGNRNRNAKNHNAAKTKPPAPQAVQPAAPPASPPPASYHNPPPLPKYKWFIEHKPVVEFVGTILLLLYTTVAAFQWKAIVASNAIARESSKIARDTFNAANRPYVGVFGSNVNYIEGPPEALVFRQRPTKNTDRMAFEVGVKDFGTVPALKTTIDWRIFIGERELAVTDKRPDTPFTAFPGNPLLRTATVGGEDYIDVVVKQAKLLDVQVYYRYEWLGHKEAECEREEYSAGNNAFFNLGECIRK